jgi:hypothetical protein
VVPLHERRASTGCTAGRYVTLSQARRLLLASFLATSMRADDYQLRVFAHRQWITAGSSWGVAAWGVLQDVTAHPQRALVLGGAVYSKKKRWLEIMAGSLVVRNQVPSFQIDARFLDASRAANIFMEAQYNTRAKSLALMPVVTVPLRVPGVRLRVGVEGDLTLAKERRSFVSGPRVALGLPICRRLCRDASFITAYRFQSGGRRVLRNYIGLTF